MTLNADKEVRTFKLDDPEAQREAERYACPIPSRELITQFLEKYGAPLTREEIAEELGIEGEEDMEALRRRLRAMERDAQLLRNRQDRYCLINKKDLISGRVIGHPDGFGFLKPDAGGGDLFLSPKEMRSLMHDDRVVVRVKGVDRRGRREAAVVEILERNTQHVVGRLYMESGINFVVPDNKKIAQDILIPDRYLTDASHGQIVVVEILEQPSRRAKPVGRVTEILGDHMAPGLEIEVAIRAHELPCVWPAGVLEEIGGLEESVPQTAKENRVDLRETPLVTIDGEDARDFDDAVYCKRTSKGWRLMVAIADVSHYVAPDTELDQEAVNRGTSVYFPERVIPMLPEVLSNGLCSINPHEDRLCMVCELYISNEGQVYRTRFFEGVMRSHARLTYTEVAGILVDKKRGLRKKYSALVPHLEELYALYQVLRKSREQRGAIDFDTQESRIVFGEGRKIEKIVPTQRNDAHRLIEECMIMANIAAARFLKRQRIPHLLRVHEGPSTEKINDLRSFLGQLGLQLPGGDEPKPGDYMKLIESIRERPDAHLIQTVLLRSLSQAEYSPQPKGHFGLALEVYTHFTSPIRRYPDLLIHRAIRHCLRRQKRETFRYTPIDMVRLGEHCSATERRADDATRDVVSWLKCEYMMDKLGETLPGVISAVTSFGFFVELTDIFVEGLVHISTLGRDYFHFDPIGHRLNGERSGISYRLGDSVHVVVARVDLDERKIDFDLVEAKPKKRRRRKR
jgi:ribonuclease R